MRERLPSYGGQAVMEGVMMRGSQSVAIAMRSPDNQIVIHKEKLGKVYQSKLTKIPFLRGLVMLWDALGLGMRALTISANLQTGEDEKLEGPALYLTLAFSLGFAVLLFFLLPAGIGHLTQNILSQTTGQNLVIESQSGAQMSENSTQTKAVDATNHEIRSWQNWTGNIVEGLVRLALLVGYIYLVGKIPDIRRVFMYHGAEHKTINAFEDHAELTVDNVVGYPLEHPRCGTSFLLTLVLLSIVLFTLLGPLPIFWRLISRILFIPLLAGLAYEFIRWTANHLHWTLVRWLIKPNLALQRLTTREPSPDMLEVSIAAFNAMRVGEEGKLSL
jgi:uncharacterized protein YqhQ